MGYRISTLASLPAVAGIHVYVFVLGERAWNEGMRGSIERNFTDIAKHIGSSAAIILGHDGVDLAGQLVEALQERPEVHRLVETVEVGPGGILILGAHPKTFSTNDLLLYSPMKHLESQFGSAELFFEELCEFTVNGNNKFLERFEQRNNILVDTLDIIELNPSIFGVGININNALRKILVNKTIRKVFPDWGQHESAHIIPGFDLLCEPGMFRFIFIKEVVGAGEVKWCASHFKMSLKDAKLLDWLHKPETQLDPRGNAYFDLRVNDPSGVKRVLMRYHNPNKALIVERIM